MRDIVNDYFKRFYPKDWETHEYRGGYQNGDGRRYNGVVDYQVFPRIFCVDGFSLSVQARATSYCTPRGDFEPVYDSVEIGYPTERVEEFMPYIDGAQDSDPLNSVYGYVPVDIVNAVIATHGGILEEPRP